MALNSGQKIIISVVALSLLAVVIFALVIIPSALSVKKTTNEIYELRAYLEKRYMDSLNSHLTKNKLEKIKQESTDFPLYLFKVSDTLKLIQILETITNNNKVVQKINSSNLDKIKPGEKVIINLTISGGYRDVLNYIQDIENMDYFSNIETLRLTPASINNINANLIIRLYVGK